MIDFNVELRDSKSGQLVLNGAVARIDTLPNLAIFPPTRSIGAGTANFYHGPPLGAAVQVVVTVEAAGYVPWTNGDVPLVFQAETINVVVPLVPFR